MRDFKKKCKQKKPLLSRGPRKLQRLSCNSKCGIFFSPLSHPTNRLLWCTWHLPTFFLSALAPPPHAGSRSGPRKPEAKRWGVGTLLILAKSAPSGIQERNQLSRFIFVFWGSDCSTVAWGLPPAIAGTERDKWLALEFYWYALCDQHAQTL